MVFSKNSNSKFIILYSANTYGPGDLTQIMVM